MAINTSATENAPYFDDWSTGSGNSSKNYLKILFQPGRAVQVRELNQIQSAIQAQIDKFGQHVFSNGSRVLDGEIDVDRNVKFLDLTLSAGGANAAADSSRPLIGKTIYADNGSATPSGTSPNGPGEVDVSATIMDYELLSGTEYRFYLRYTSEDSNFNGGSGYTGPGGVRTDESVKVGTNIRNAAGDVTYVSADGALGSGSAAALDTGYALKLHNNKGVYFANGYFVETPEQTKYINTNSTSESRKDIDGKVGFKITESTVTAVNDNSLYDNAQGTSNFSAPGADRYVISLGLCLIVDTATTGVDTTPAHVVGLTEKNIIDVIPLVQSEVSAPVETKYSKLGDTLSQRTREESGDYTLQPFKLDLREHFDTGFNRGKSTSGDKRKMVVGIEPSIAYVQGKRIEILKKQEIVTDKADDTETVLNSEIQARQGSYIELDSIQYLPNPNANAASGQVTYTIKDGSAATVATCRCRGIEKIGRKFRFYVSPVSTGKDLTMASGKVLSEGRTITGTSIDADQTFTGTSNTAMILKDVGNTSMLFPVPATVVKSLTNVSGSGTISIPVKTTESVTSSSTSITLQTLGSGSKYYQDNPTEYIITKDSDGSVVEATAVGFSSNNQVATLTIPDISNAAVHVSYSIKKTATKNVKAIQRNESETIGSATSDYNIGEKISLANTDVIRFSTIVDQSGADISDSFILNNGQTNTTYGNAYLVAIKTVTNKQIVITYDYFNHTTASNDAFWVDSYTALETSVERAEVGFHGSTNLTDAIDFRGTNTAIDPNGVIEFTHMEYYLPRVDKLVLTKEGDLKYLKGNSTVGTAPKTPENSMVLYELSLPAYVDSVQQINVNYIDNKRYTMRDIGKLEKRVKNLEYYTSLSLLEKMTQDEQILDDATQTDRFKNGIIVDEFRGHGIGNPRDPGYLCATEPETGILRPSFIPTNLPITNNDNIADDKSTGSTSDPNPINTGLGEDFVRLPSSSINELIKQPFASVAISVNPFDVASWVGSLKLSPSSDEWRDTNRRPEVTITSDGGADAMLNIINERLASSGTRWGDWTTTWSGITEREDLGFHGIVETANLVEEANLTSRSHRGWRNMIRNQTHTITVPTMNGGTLSGRSRQRSRFELEQQTTTSRQIREGVQEFARETTHREELGDRVVDVSFIPFIRSRKLYFRGTGLKPNTKVLPFFDGVDVSGYAVPTAFQEYREESTFQDHTGDTAPVAGKADLVTNDAGTVTGYLIIPQNDALRFKTGERELLLVDNPSNLSGANLIPEKLLPVSNTYCKGQYTARGMLQTVESQVLTTRRIVLDERRLDSSNSEAATRTITSTDIVATGNVRHRDPIAQTFVVDPDLYSQGVFLHDIDIFFNTIDENLPVHLYIAPTTAGIPTQQVVPFSEVTKYPSAQAAVDAGAAGNLTDGAKHVATADTNAATATKFVFEAPVYLKAGVEYSFVMLSNSPDYTVWHSEVGGTDVTAGAGGKQIVKNPYTGVALKSANASTWTPDQNKDIKFTMNYMKFFESGTSVTQTIGEGETGTGFGSFITHFPTGTSISAPHKVDSICLNAEEIVLPETSISYNLIVNDGASTITYPIAPGQTINLPDTVSFDANTSNTSIKLKTTLTSENAFVTPVVDVTRLSLLTLKNDINGGASIVNESAASAVERRDTHGSATARYITRPVVLENASSQLNVIMDIARPAKRTDVDVYARFDGATGNDSYVKLEAGEIPISGNFREVRFRTPALADTERQFSKFQVKIVMRAIDDGSASVINSGATGYETGTNNVSENTALVPQIRNFRAIATA